MNFSKALWTLGSLIGAQQAARAMHSFEANDLLGLIGLQRRRSTDQMLVPAIGFIALGAVLGAATALLVAPSSGADLRQRLSDRVDKLADKFDDLKNHQCSTPESNPASNT
jgi:hypothetical protein